MATPNFDFKGQFPTESLVSGLQRKAEVENQHKVDEFNRSQQLVRESVQQASQVVSGMVEQSKSKRKQEFIQALASKFSDPATAAAAHLEPDIASALLLKQALPGAASGTPPRSFESYLISQVNAGAMTPEEAAQQLSQLKPSNVVIGYDDAGQPIYSNTKATKPSAQPLSMGTVKGGVKEKLERVSEAELGKQADVENLRIASGEVEKNFDPSFVGAAEGRLNNLKQMVPGMASTKRADFIASLNSYRNSVIKAITGAQMSELEAHRIMKQLPDEKMSEVDFKAKLRISRKLLEQGLVKRRKQLERGGFTGIPQTSPDQSGPVDLGDGFTYEVIE